MNATFDFSGRSIFVTGASSGIGRATVEMLCASGADVVAAARNANELARLAEETGCEPLKLDVSDEAAINEAFLSLGAFDGLVNCAGIALLERAVETSAESFDRVLAVYAGGAALVA
jgi:NADP-dependent 3-hydroxy acid dehydrogenase YdfG